MFFPDINISSASESHKTIIEIFSNQQMFLFLSIFVLKSFKKLGHMCLGRSEERERHFCAHLSKLPMFFLVVNPTE